MIRNKIKLYLKKLLSGVNDSLLDNIVCFVCGNVALPKPLTADEEYKLLAQLGSENENNAKVTLIEHNIRLVVYIAKKFSDSGYDSDDLVSVGSIGLIKAINSFKTDKNIKLATYASRCIQNEILMYLRKNCKYKMQMSIDEPLNFDYDGNELSLSDLLTTDTDTVTESIDKTSEKFMVTTVLDKLPPREKEIMQMRFGIGGIEEKTQKQVADIMGISQSYISRLEKKIFSRLKKEVQKIG